jgi:ATPase family associated with various cellular activities (AAA)/AAA lid domain
VDRCQQSAKQINALSCRRCGRAQATPGVCSACLDVLQLCGEIRTLVVESAPHLQAMVNRDGVAVNVAEALRLDFTTALLTFAVADGPIAASELTILADLWSYLLPEEVTSSNSASVAVGLAEAFLKTNNKPVPAEPRTLALVDTFDRSAGTHYGITLRSLLFRMANLVIQADGVVSGPEKEFLSYYETMLRSGWGEMARTEPAVHQQTQCQAPSAQNSPRTVSSAAAPQSATQPALPPERPVESVMAELNGLTGLGQVKVEVAKLVSFLKVEQMKKSRGLKSAEVSLHMEFYGNPGTGKTTVARLMAQIYRSLGFVSRGQLIEADRSKLIGAWLGQTALKTAEVIEQALGGVLFIDEAYSLARTDGQEDIYGKEAIETILKSMEDHRDNLIVIVAGYPAEMAKFFASNPGLKSRFNRFINFEDYSPDELFRIFDHMATEKQYRISESAAQKLRTVFDMAFRNRDRNFGNGRFVRNLFEASLQQLAMRIVTLPRVSNECLMTIEAQDLPDPDAVATVKVKRAAIGFTIPQPTENTENNFQPQVRVHSTAVWRSPFNFDDEINHDPQEDDPRLSAFFEAAQKEAEGTGDGPAGPGGTQALARRMKAILKAKYGIDWKTIFEMNPGLHLD